MEDRAGMIILTQNKQAVWNFDDISRLHVTGRGQRFFVPVRKGTEPCKTAHIDRRR